VSVREIKTRLIDAKAPKSTSARPESKKVVLGEDSGEETFMQRMNSSCCGGGMGSLKTSTNEPPPVQRRKSNPEAVPKIKINEETF